MAGCRTWALWVLLGVAVCGWPAAARAGALHTVTTTADSDDGSCTVSVCSLRDAVGYSADGDAISLPAGTYLLTLGDLILNHGVSIVGAGAASTTIDGGRNFRVFTVKSGSSALESLTVTHGNATSTLSGPAGNDGVGGAIWVDTGATFGLDQVAVLDSSATASGGGIDNNGTLTLDASTVAGNTVSGGLGIGGGIDNYGSAVNLFNTTIADNTAAHNGGGINNGAGLTTISTTIADNQSANSAGGGVQNDGSWELLGTLLGSNSGGMGTNCAGAGSVTDDGDNLDDGTSCALGATGDVSSQDPLLSPLAVNSPGQVATIALGAGSAAIGADAQGFCPATDERGANRPTSGGCDIGAYDTAGGGSAGGGTAEGLLTQLSGAAGCASLSAPGGMAARAACSRRTPPPR